jgi:parallel beta-helix repeat protein
MRSRPFALAVSGLITFTAAEGFAKQVPVSTPTELYAAIAAATAGDEIILAPGTYAFSSGVPPVSSQHITCAAAGTPAAPIIVRSATPLAAKLEFDLVDGFNVTGPNWHFEGLDIRGTCADDSNCEHAFHVVGQATGFVARNNHLHDFNAEVKVNAAPSADGTTHDLPDGGLLEGNEIWNSHPRNTGNPVNSLNIDNGSSWIVRANFVHDFTKAGGNGISFGIFNKGGAKSPIFERNLVICSLDDASAATRIGLSFGGGGQSPDTCAPAFDASVPCDLEIQDGIMRNNVVVNCSDVGIYINKGKNTRLLHNTLIGTSGIDFRFANSTGEAHGNVLDGGIHPRDGGTFTGDDNLISTLAELQGFYTDPLHGDLTKKGDLAALLEKGTASPLLPDDYCARPRGATPDWGALESSLGDCDTFPPVLSGSGAGGGAATGTGVGSGGTATSGGNTGSGGGSGASAGGAGGQGANGDTVPGKGGCGCHIGEANGEGGGALAALAVAALGCAARSRQRRAGARRREIT